MNELLNTLFNAFDDQNSSYYRTTYATPKVDVTETKDAYKIQMDLPGKTENDINIELDRGTLKISSIENEKSLENKEEKSETSQAKFLIKERSNAKFSRSFTLPEDIDTQNIAASFKNGVLNVIIPRKAISSPKKIAITA